MSEPAREPSPSAPGAEERYLRARRTTTWAGWLSMIIVGLFAVAGLIAAFVSGEAEVAAWFLGLAVALPVAWLVFTALVIRSVRRRQPRAAGLVVWRACLTILPFAYLAFLGFWLFIGILFIPPLVALVPVWVAELVAEIAMIAAAVRVRRAWRALATGA
jgi:uncharacterized membrane protein YhdT